MRHTLAYDRNTTGKKGFALATMMKKILQNHFTPQHGGFIPLTDEKVV